MLLNFIIIYIYISVSFCDVDYSDTETLVGLPRPIHESVKTLKQVRVKVALIIQNTKTDQSHCTIFLC